MANYIHNMTFSIARFEMSYDIKTETLKREFEIG